MSEEFALVAPKVVIPPAVVMPPVEQAPLPGVTIGEPPPEQARAAEAYFTRQEENRLVAGLMGLWTSGLLLHDLAAEHFESRDDLDEARLRQKPRGNKKNED
jgi:hypothetical protein